MDRRTDDILSGYSERPEPKPQAELRQYTPSWSDTIRDTGNDFARWAEGWLPRDLGNRTVDMWRMTPTGMAYHGGNDLARGNYVAGGAQLGLAAMSPFLGTAAKNFAVKPPLPREAGFRIPIKQDGNEVGSVRGHVAGDTAYVSGASRQPVRRGPAEFDEWMAAEYPGVLPPPGANLDSYRSAWMAQLPELSWKAAGKNSVGYPEMRRVFNELRSQFPQTSRVVADRISGARERAGKHSGVEIDDISEGFKQRMWERGGVLDEGLGQVDRLTKGGLGNSRAGQKILEHQEAVESGLGKGGMNGYNLDIQTVPEWERILRTYGRRGID